jgi:hypothetical protein
MVTIPTSGVIAPADDEQLYVAIEDVARNYLGFTPLREAIENALGTVAEFDSRDAIESAYNASRVVSDQVYFYAGLAFGVTIARFGDAS